MTGDIQTRNYRLCSNRISLTLNNPTIHQAISYDVMLNIFPYDSKISDTLAFDDLSIYGTPRFSHLMEIYCARN